MEDFGKPIALNEKSGVGYGVNFCFHLYLGFGVFLCLALKGLVAFGLFLGAAFGISMNCGSR